MKLRQAAATVAVLIAAAVTAAPAPAQQPVVLQGLDCRGDDGWRLDANRTSAMWTAVAPRKRVVVFRGSLQAIAAPAPPAIVWRGDSTHLPRETLVLTAQEAACKVAPPDFTATHRVVLSIRAGEAVTGCCAVRAGFDARVSPVANLGQRAAGDWSRQLLDLLPAVNACVNRDGARLKAVAGAAPSGPASVKVRLIENGGNAVDCTVEASGRGTPALVAVTPGGAPVSGNPLFYPPRDPPPIVSCGRLERVQTTRGALVGFLHYDPC